MGQEVGRAPRPHAQGPYRSPCHHEPLRIVVKRGEEKRNSKKKERKKQKTKKTKIKTEGKGEHRIVNALEQLDAGPERSTGPKTHNGRAVAQDMESASVVCSKDLSPCAGAFSPCPSNFKPARLI